MLRSTITNKNQGFVQFIKRKKRNYFGALNQHSIAWKTAQRAHEEGAEFVLTNAPAAMRMGELDVLAKKNLQPFFFQIKKFSDKNLFFELQKITYNY